MPIYIHLANLIIPKKIIQEKFLGGIIRFKKQYFNYPTENQEDDHLFSISKLNPDEFEVQSLVDSGIHYDLKNNISSDFVIITRYSGLSWSIDWIKDNGVFAWHIDAPKNQIERANTIANCKMEQIEKMFNIGYKPFQTIKSK